jgi:Protein of unknown function (DUF3192)
MLNTVRRMGCWGLILGAGALTAACDAADGRLKNLAVGIAKDSIVARMGAKPDTMESYLIDGHYFEALYYIKQGKTDPLSRTMRQMAPIVAVDGKLAGWGWVFWDSLAAAHKIQVAPASK